MADTELQRLIIYVGTTAQIDAAIQAGTITENDLAISTDAPDFQEKLTEVQMNAVNSGITTQLVSLYSDHVADTTIHVTEQNKTTWNNKQDAISDLDTIRSGASAGATAVQPNDMTTAISTHNTSSQAHTDIRGLITTETTNRENADIGLQSQIDAIVASSDVTDIVGTYAQLQAYDTSSLPPNSIIKVLQDESQNDETTYYRWVINGGVGSWVLIGEEGPYYTKSEADSRFATAAQGAKADTAVQPSQLAAVATSGSYNDLSNKPTIPSLNSTNNYVPYRSSVSALSNSTLLYNSSAMAFTGKLHIGSSSPSSYSNFGRLTLYDNTPSSQVSSIALLNYGGGGGCGVAIDMYNTSANGGIPSGRFGVVDNGNYSGYLQLKVKKSGSQSNPLLPAMNIVPVPASNSLTTCVSFGQDEFNRVLFDLHKPEATTTITDSDKRWSGSGTTYYVTGSNKFNLRLLVAVGDIVSFNNGSTEARVVGITSNTSTLEITTDVSLGSVSNASILVKKAYFKITDENNNIKVYVDPYGKFGIGTGTPAYDLDVDGSINASTDVKRNGVSLSSVTFYWGE